MSDDTTLTASPATASEIMPPAEALTFEWDAWLSSRLAVISMSLEEAAAWAIVIVLGLVSRLLLLGDPPLNLDESQQALQAYTLLHEGRITYESAPILTNLTSLLFGLFTDGDLQARLVPALSGVALILTPILMRPVLGRWWCLLTAVVLLLSTTLLAASRTLSPTVPTALCLAVTGLSAWRFGITHERGWLIAAVAAAAVGIGVDTSYVVGLIGLVLAYAIAEGEIFGRSHWWEPVARHGRLALAIGFGLAVALDTRLLMNTAGVQAGLIDPLWRWTGEISRGAGLTAPVLLVLLDGAVLLLAIIGLIEYRRRSRQIRFLGTWLLVSLTLASLMRMPDTRYLAQPLVPAALLAGFGLLNLMTWIKEAGSLRTTVLGLLTLVPVVTAAFQINAGLRANLSPWGSAGVVLVAGLLLAGILAFNLLRGLQLAAAFSTWLLVLLTLGSLAGAMRAVGAHGEDRGQLVVHNVVTPDMAYIREIALKWYRAAPDGPLMVEPALQPLVAWELRDIPTVRFDNGANTARGPRLLATPPAQVAPDTRTLRTIVGYAADWQTLSLQPSRVWRWVVTRESLVTLRPYGIVVVQPAGS
ncbi:MAG: glycosyltransferase family 39 protein [Chloroflexota bacterium]